VKSIKYYHKNLIYPHLQQYPHCNVKDEISFLDYHSNTLMETVSNCDISISPASTNVSYHILGSMKDAQDTDNYFIYVATSPLASIASQEMYPPAIMNQCDIEGLECRRVCSSASIVDGDVSSDSHSVTNDSVHASRSSVGSMSEENYSYGSVPVFSPTSIACNSDDKVLSRNGIWTVGGSNSSSCQSESVTFSLMMFELDETCMSQFYREYYSDVITSEDSNENGRRYGKLMTNGSGIPLTLPEGTSIDEFAFAPCGYSMNAVHENAYYTIHITPEPHCSYVSYETNDMSIADYNLLLQNVLRIFKPRKFMVTLHGGEDTVMMNQVSIASKMIAIGVSEDVKTVYSRDSTSAIYRDEDSFSCVVSCYSNKQ
jgi:hypothetical protein